MQQCGPNNLKMKVINAHGMTGRNRLSYLECHVFVKFFEKTVTNHSRLNVFVGLGKRKRGGVKVDKETNRKRVMRVTPATACPRAQPADSC